MDKIKVNYIASIGDCCITAWFMKHNGLKKCSYPLDWIVTGELSNVIDCLDNDFENFLNKSKYIDAESERSDGAGHLDYHKNMFIHRDPREEEHYEYYRRCVDRFRLLLSKDDPKLFIFTNQGGDTEPHKKIVRNLNKELRGKTNNYYILILSCKLGKKRNKKVEIDDNVVYVELTTITEHNGLHFENTQDTKLYVDTILELFDFEILDDIR